LRDGDTIFVPRAENNYVYVTGAIRTPGAYPVRKDTTVLQAISLAGGFSENGSQSRIRILRLVDGEKKEIRVKLDDVVLPGDTIKVPERYF
jgi:polysaccharide export outer membrane protein